MILDDEHPRPADETPLSSAEALDALRSALSAQDGACVLAVSGGPDSTALMGFAAEAAEALAPLRFVVATVDHGLREASRGEAAGVAEAARALGLEARVLRWETARPPARGLLAAAREARRRLLLDCARAVGAGVVATAHTRDDQAETVLMRLAAGSGIDGLAGMAARSAFEEIVLARPLLAVPKSRLVATCRARGWSFVEDPTNRDRAYARPRLRALAPALAGEGLTPGRLARLARRAASARDALDACARACFMRVAAPAGEGGGLALDGRALAAEPFEIALRTLALAIDAASPGGEGRDGAYGPRLARLEALCEALRGALASGAPMRGRTLAGVRVEAGADGRVLVAPARPRRPHPAAIAAPLVAH